MPVLRFATRQTRRFAQTQSVRRHCFVRRFPRPVQARPVKHPSQRFLRMDILPPAQWQCSRCPCPNPKRLERRPPAGLFLRFVAFAPGRRPALRFCRQRRQILPPEFGQHFGFRTRNQRAAVHGNFEAAERGRTGNVLQRLALAAAFDEFAQRIRFRRGERALEIQIQFHARQFEQMRQQEFGLQARRINALLGEKFRTFLNGFENRHATFHLSAGAQSVHNEPEIIFLPRP